MEKTVRDSQVRESVGCNLDVRRRLQGTNRNSSVAWRLGKIGAGHGSDGYARLGRCVSRAGYRPLLRRGRSGHASDGQVAYSAAGVGGGISFADVLERRVMCLEETTFPTALETIARTKPGKHVSLSDGLFPDPPSKRSKLISVRVVGATVFPKSDSQVMLVPLGK